MKTFISALFLGCICVGLGWSAETPRNVQKDPSNNHLTNGNIVAGDGVTISTTGTGQIIATNAGGTVGSVSVVDANGVSATVANPTTTPALTFTLGVITPTTVNGLTLTNSTGTLTIANAKVLTASNTLTLAGTDGSTLDIGTGGTLGTNAFTSTAYLPLTGGTLSGNLTFSDTGEGVAFHGGGTITGASGALSFAPTTGALTLLEPGAPSTKSGQLGTGNWFTSFVPYFRPNVANKPGIFDVLANGTGQDSWIDIGTDYTTGTGVQEFVDVKYYNQSYGSVSMSALAAGTIRLLQLQGGGNNVIVGGDTVNPVGNGMLRVKGGGIWCGFESIAMPTSTAHGLRVSSFDNTSTAERSAVQIDTYNATAANGSILAFWRSAGSRSSKSAVATGSSIGQIDGYAYGSTGFSSAPRAQILMLTTEAWSDSAQGTAMTGSTTAVGGTTTTEAFRVTSARNLIIGSDAAETGLTGAGGVRVTSTTEATSSAGAAMFLGGISAAKKIWPGGGILGTATNDAAASGTVGESVSSLVASGSPVSLTDSTAANVTSVSLTAGDWDVSANANFTAAAATVTSTTAGISATTATLPTDGSEAYSGVTLTVGSTSDTVTLATKRVSLSSTTTIYLVAQRAFSAGTTAGFGALYARRVR